MVKRVFGRVDGRDVELDMDTGNRWSVPVPFDTDGEYVIEIIAEDEAGNRSYMAKMLYVVNTALLCAHLIRLPYYGELLLGSFQAGSVVQRRFAGILDPPFSGSVSRNGFYGELVESECT